MRRRLSETRHIPSLCKVPSCHKRVRAGKALMCPGHWAKVPKPLADLIYNTIYDWNTTGDARPYLDAVRQAIDAVIALEAQKTAAAAARARQGKLDL